MKKEIKQEPIKLTVDDFPLQMQCKVSLEEYQNYALWGSEEAQNVAKKKSLKWGLVLILAGIAVLYRGLTSTWVYHDWLTIIAVLLMAYAVVDIFYQYVLFRSVLKHSIKKQYNEDSRLGREMTFCFAEDRMVSFYKGAHQGTFYYDEVTERQENDSILMLTVKSGKVIVFPKHIVEKAQPEIQNIIARLGA